VSVAVSQDLDVLPFTRHYHRYSVISLLHSPAASLSCHASIPFPSVSFSAIHLTECLPVFNISTLKKGIFAAGYSTVRVFSEDEDGFE
jgi:hypothetical protein